MGRLAAPTRRASTQPRDLGDEVADRMDAQMGRIGDAVSGKVPARRASAQPRDLGDEVADRIEMSLYGKLKEQVNP